METTKPYWADACEHPIGSYVGSFRAEVGRCDVYLFQDSISEQVCIRWGANKNMQTHRNLSDIAADIYGCFASRAMKVINESRAAQPAPAMTRSAMIEAMARKMSKQIIDYSIWDDAHENFRRECREAAELGLLESGAIQPLPKPAPVEPVKTEGMALVERCDHQPDRYDLVSEIDALLAARDTAHAAELEALRERCVMAGDEARRKGYDVGTHIRNVPLTAAPEAK